MKGFLEKFKKIDWEEYRRQRTEVTREEEIEMGKALFKFALRFLWAKIRGKRVVKVWTTLQDGMRCFEFCDKSEIVTEREISCSGCYRRQKAGSKIIIFQPLFFTDEEEKNDMTWIMCEECANAYTDKNKFREYEKKRTDFLGC